MKINKLVLLPLFLLATACNSVNSTPLNSTSTSSNSSSSSSITSVGVLVDLSIEIQKSDITVSEFNIIEGETTQLTAINNKNVDIEIVWNSANANIATIDEKGLLTAEGTGITVVTAKVKDAPYISASIYVTVKEKVIQTGVGSGETPDDAIFLGNEGESEPLEIYFFEMQHIYADSIYIKKGNVDILIDAGWDYDAKYISKFLTEHMNDDVLDVLMFSHSDGDHIDGAITALQNISSVSLMVDYGGLGNDNVGTLRKKYTANGTVYHSAYDCVNGIDGAFDRYYLTEEFYFDVLNTGEYITSTEKTASNPNSLTTIFYYKDFSFFTAGDITTATETKLLKNEVLPEVTLYKASHHGSNGSNSQNLLNELNPKAVAISAARANQYNVTPTGPTESNTYNLNGVSGHPYEDAIQRIYKAPNISENLNVYWNAVNGTMKFTSYGENDYTFEGSPTMKGYYDLTITGGTAVWNSEMEDFENKVTGEENCRLHETKIFEFRNYIKYLPTWAQEQYFSN